MKWSGGIAEWLDGDVAHISVAFTWLLPEAYTRCAWHRSAGRRVRVGGPAVFTEKGKRYLEGMAEIGGAYPDAIARHNPAATIASRGCPVGCWFCIVPKMEGAAFTLLPDFPVRPVLCDNNLSALPAEYQEHIIGRYEREGVPLLDANSGFEPRTFDDAVFARWKRINRGPWRFAYDDHAERPFVERVMKMLKDVRPELKRVYVLIGNEPVGACLERINEVVAWGGQPHAQPFIKLNALVKAPQVRFDWTAQTLTNMARWTNRFLWKYTPFEEYRRSARTSRPDVYNQQDGLFA